jgi:lysophospholipase L1-like esterase
MRRLATTTLHASIWLASVSLITAVQPSAASASDLVWEVQSPFRFFKKQTAYTLHEKAFDAVRGNPESPLPANIVWRTERRLNDPDCGDKSSPVRCEATARKGFERSRLGWAAQTLDMVCYERSSRPFRYPVVCDRQYSWGTAKEDYILPDAHTVEVSLSKEQLAAAGTGECTWTFQSRAGGKTESGKHPCKDAFIIKRVPYSPDQRVSGGEVKVKLPDGRELAEAIAVQDVLVVAMGDSFMSGESNPDRPVTFSAAREMVYDPTMANDRERLASRGIKDPAKASAFGLASTDDQFDVKSLPRRRMEDEDKGLIYGPSSPEFLKAFNKGGAQWLSADCHRSQYGYPFRVGIEMTLENRHRAVTLVSLACSGAQVLNLFKPHDARERADEPGGAQSRPQLDQLADLICRGGASGRTQSASYTLPVFKFGSTGISSETYTKQWCPAGNRKRSIDLVLLSIGGNDVGFGSLAMYASTESAKDLAPIAGLVGSEIRFGPDVARAYLGVLDKRIKAVRDALVDGFGVEPARVLQNAYEPIQYDETGSYCGSQPTLGMDVHPSLKVSKARLSEVSDFSFELEKRLACMASTAGRSGCPAGLATGSGTGFRFITEHTAEFTKRGICAREPTRVLADQAAMKMPRRSKATGEFEPYSPAFALPYAHRWRLIHNPNDAFLTANTHREGISPFDILQPSYAALYSGAFHPTAEGHAIVADHVMRHVRALLDREKKPVVEGRLN